MQSLVLLELSYYHVPVNSSSRIDVTCDDQVENFRAEEFLFPLPVSVLRWFCALIIRVNHKNLLRGSEPRNKTYNYIYIGNKKKDKLNFQTREPFLVKISLQKKRVL